MKFYRLIILFLFLFTSLDGLAQICASMSSKVILKPDSTNFSPNSSIITSDNNILTAGHYYKANSGYPIAYTLKTDTLGNLIWAKRYEGGPGVYHFDIIHELPDQNIVVAGISNIISSTSTPTNLMLSKLDRNGSFVWTKTFMSPLWPSPVGASGIEVYEVNHDPAGNIYVTGQIRGSGSIPSHSFVVKIDANGTFIWSKAFQFTGIPYAFGVAFKGQDLLVFGKYNTGSLSDTRLLAMQLKQTTGDIVRIKTWLPDSTNPSRFFFANYVRVTQLNNGNIGLAGRLLYDVNISDNGIAHHAGVLQITSDLSQVKGYEIKSNLVSTGTGIYQYADESVDFSFMRRITSSAEKIFIGHIEKQRLIKERYISYNGKGQQTLGIFLKGNKGNSFLLQSINDKVLPKTTLELMNLHHSDVSGSCLGTDTSLMTIAQLAYKEMTLDKTPAVYNNVFTEITVPVCTAFADNFTRSFDCQAISFCNPVKITSAQQISCISTGVTINLHRNAECGVRPIWSFDTSVISKATYLNDTTLRLNFRRAWEGYIHASLNSCSESEDSLKLTVFDSPPIVDLGPDTVLCPANNIILNAKSGFLNYSWQDGSTDSFFTVKAPGQYYVKATDGCGNLFFDTVLVRSAPSIPFDLGADKTKCNNDSVHVSAPTGFISYKWTPATGINNPKSGDVFLSPDSTTQYTIAAEKTKGCFAYDSIIIYVNHSPPINLGADTTLCDGQSLLVSAGSGFANYKWSNQATSSAITVSTAGKYFVSAADANSCISTDTLNITVNTTPVFSLGADTILCGNQSMVLKTAVSGNYLWQDRTILSQTTITKAGVYWLQVNRDKCVFRDSILVQYMPLPVVSLGADTTLCNSGTLRLSATQNTPGATYQWQDGSSSPTYTVSKAGSYYVVVKQSGCSNADTCRVSYLQSPHIDLGSDTTKCQDDVIRLSAFADNSFCRWNENSTAQFIDVVKPGLYYCTVSNFCGIASDTIFVSNKICECEAMIPNVFSPNADGINDKFKYNFNCTPIYFFIEIFNRNGQIVFKGDNPSDNWDGTYNNKPAPIGSYYYILKIKGASDPFIKKKTGMILLIR